MRTPFFIAFFAFLILYASQVRAQGGQQIIQFSGVIIDEQELPVPGAYLYVPKAGRGTSTNQYGFFSMPTLAGDSVVISAIGYKKRFFRMPERTDNAYSVVIELKEDTTLLPVVEIYPYSTEEAFKEAFLALELPDEKQQVAMRKNLDKDLLLRMMYETGADASVNYRYYMNQQVSAAANRNFNPSYSFLNPFAWAQFIKSVKRGDLKKKEYRQNKD